jgi:hypothetical protein
LIEVGNDHRLADLEPLAAMLKAFTKGRSATKESSDKSPHSKNR